MVNIELELISASGDVTLAGGSRAGVCGTAGEDSAGEILEILVSRADPEATIAEGAVNEAIVDEEPRAVNDDAGDGNIPAASSACDM